METPKHKQAYINVDGQKLYYEQYIINPSNPTLILLHDSLGCVELWRDLPQKLALKTNYNIFVYDRLGYGKSAAMQTTYRPINYMSLEAEVVKKLMDKFNFKNPVLLGHSDGGTIALLTASLYPKNIKAVIAEAAHIFVEKITLAGIQQAQAAYKNTNLPQKLYKYHKENTKNLFEAWVTIWQSERFKQWNIEPELQQINCPVFFIQGEADEYGSLLQLDKTLENVQGETKKLILPETGHTVHKEKPNLFIEKIAEFLLNLPS